MTDSLTIVVATGEQLQVRGAEGVRRAKRWLNATCRVQVYWDNPRVCPEKLQYRKACTPPPPHPPAQGEMFSFDLGGVLIGDGTHGHDFLAEVKSGDWTNGLGVEYRRFLAKCYRAETVDAHPKSHYLWIAWVPFLVTEWSSLTSSDFVRAALTHDEACRAIALCSTEADDASVKRVADKVVIVILSQRQERLLSLSSKEAARVRLRLTSAFDSSAHPS